MDSLLSPEHLVALSVVAIVITCLTVIFALASARWGATISRALAAVLIIDGLLLVQASYSTRWMNLASKGFVLDQFLQALPLQLWDIVIPIAALALIFRWKLLMELTYFWGLAGSTQALITPALSKHFPDFAFIQYYVAHGGVVAAAFALVVGLGQRPREEALKSVAKLTAAFVGIVAIVDIVGHANYMYLRNKPPQPTLLDAMGGWPWYLLEAGLLLIGILVVLDLPFRWSKLSFEQQRVLAIGVLVISALTPLLFALDFSVWAWATWDPTVFSIADRLGAVAGALTAATLSLAALAALVAIMAYAVATRRPKLVPRIKFPDGTANDPVFVVEGGRLIDIGDRLLSGNLQATVEIENTGNYSGRNPALRISLVGLSGLNPEGQRSGWNFVPIEGPAMVARWDGEGVPSIHGNWTHQLPALNFADVTYVSSPAELELEVVAEGFRHTERVTVTTKSLKDWVKEDPKRRDKLGPEVIALLDAPEADTNTQRTTNPSPDVKAT